jgi:hypothetical protein
LDGIRLWEILAERSPLAQNGIRLLRKLNVSIATTMEKKWKDTPFHQKTTERSNDKPTIQEAGRNGNPYTRYPADMSNHDTVFREWQAFSLTEVFSWCFEVNIFMNPEDFGMDFGIRLYELGKHI